MKTGRSDSRILEITPGEGGEMSMIGEVKDQAGFYGLIAKLRDLGLMLISVN